MTEPLHPAPTDSRVPRIDVEVHVVLTRRGLIAGAIAAPAVAGRGKSLLPTAADCLADNRRMVGFGPRFTGSRSHNDYIGWLHESIERVGGHVLPYDHHPCDLWLSEHTSLTVLDGAHAGPVHVSSYLPRSGGTPKSGVVGNLVYAGSAPTPSISGNVSDAKGLISALENWQKQAGAWLTATIAAMGDAAKGAVLLVDTNMPPPLTVGALAEIVGTYYVQASAGWQVQPWKKLWLVGFLPTVDTASLHNAPAGIVYIVDGSRKAAAGNYAPFDMGLVGTPSLYVDREAGNTLRKAASSKPRVRLVNTASFKKTTSPSIVGVIPGQTKKTLILNTHTDGTNFAEENGGLGIIELARYAQRLRKHGRPLKHTLVLSFVTGHFNGAPAFPQTQGFVDSHPHLVKRATAAMTIEHLGCDEWVDDEKGYRPTGGPEFGVMYVDKTLHSLARASLSRQPLREIGLARTDDNLYFGVGGALQTAGVPALSYLCGPTYLVSTGAAGDHGNLKQFNPHLQAKQVKWFADLVHRLDRH
jgi:hypothetical protein